MAFRELVGSGVYVGSTKIILRINRCLCQNHPIFTMFSPGSWIACRQRLEKESNLSEAGTTKPKPFHNIYNPEQHGNDLIYFKVKEN